MSRFLLKVCVWPLAAVAVLLGSRVMHAQEGLAAAKDLYLAASYDEALAALDRLPAAEGDSSTEALQIRAFALMALQRNDDARRAIEQLYALDPMFRVDETQASPRMQEAFRDVRRAVLPATVQREYARARELFERKAPQAHSTFARVLALLDDPDMEGHVMPDFRTVVTGFRDLSRLSLSDTPTPTPTPTPTLTPSPTPASPEAVRGDVAAAAAPAAPAVSSPAPSLSGGPDTVIVPPVAVDRALPRWEPPAGASRLLVFEGELEVAIDERGEVTAASLLEPIHPAYDQQLLRAARRWRFTPATMNGAPVAFVVTMPIRLEAP
jgi:TonB family protein